METKKVENEGLNDEGLNDEDLNEEEEEGEYTLLLQEYFHLVRQYWDLVDEDPNAAKEISTKLDRIEQRLEALVDE